MRKARQWMVVMAFVGMVATSCSKTADMYEGTLWYGEYPAVTLNGTTGELEDQTAIIVLDFLEKGQECSMMSGYAGLYAMNRETYDVRWQNRDTFYLVPKEELHTFMPTFLPYTGVISGEVMRLDQYNSDGLVVKIIELKRVTDRL